MHEIMEVYRFLADKRRNLSIQFRGKGINSVKVKPEEEEHKVRSNYHTQTNPLRTSFLVVFLEEHFPTNFL
jgi:hypothetical protein